MTYNILEGGLGRIDPIAEVIRQAASDVVVLQEVTDPDAFAKLADRLGMDQFRAENPRLAGGNVGILVKRPYEIVEAINHTPLDPRLTRAALHAIVRLGGGGGGGDEVAGEGGTDGKVAIVGLHLHAHETLADEDIRLAELPAILDIANPFRAAGMPHLLVGDFNAHHPDQIIDLKKVRKTTRSRIAAQGKVIPRELIRRLLESDYVDAHAIGRTPEQFGASFTTSQPAVRVDYIFVPTEFQDKVRRCEVLQAPLARFASDHYPVLAELDV